MSCSLSLSHSSFFLRSREHCPRYFETSLATAIREDAHDDDAAAAAAAASKRGCCDFRIVSAVPNARLLRFIAADIKDHFSSSGSPFLSTLSSCLLYTPLRSFSCIIIYFALRVLALEYTRPLSIRFCKYIGRFSEGCSKFSNEFTSVNGYPRAVVCYNRLLSLVPLYIHTLFARSSAL